MGRTYGKDKESESHQTFADRTQRGEASREATVCSLDPILEEKLPISSHVYRRREITLERKKAAEERRRLEEEKAKVGISCLSLSPELSQLLQMGARKAARLRRKAGRTKKINH